MVNYGDSEAGGRLDAQMDGIFGALADSTRRGMISRLAEGPASVGELGEPYDITAPAITKHVKVLERAGLVRRDREGRVHRLTLEAEPLRKAEEWIEVHRRFWETSLDALADYVQGLNHRTGERP